MKKKIIFAALLVMTLTRCSDFIEEENKTDVLSDELYKTASGFENLVNASYGTLRNVYSLPWMFCSGTDMYVDGRNPGPPGLSTYAELSPGELAVRNFYQTAYQSIQLCNTGIHYADLTEQTSNTPARKGELKFLRAYYYFIMAQSFGGLALVTDYYTTVQTSFDRTSEEDVYEFIVSEMDEALSLVPETSDFGRVNKRVVRHYLAKVHLTRGYSDFAASDDFSKAASYADAAINNYNLSSVSFADVFKPGNEKNSEIIFSVQFGASSLAPPPNSTTNTGSSQSGFFGPYHGGEGLAKGYPWKSYNLIATSYLYDLFTQNDVRWQATFMNVMYERYFDFYTVADKSTLNISRYYPHAWEVADTAAWRAADPVHRAKTQILPYKIISTNPVINAWEQPAVYLDNSIPSVRKFDDPTATAFGIASSTRDIYLARVAETYLVAAEAYLKLGDKATALNRINAVKARAERTPGTLVLVNPDDVDIDEILDERARELVGEYDRWFDLKRTGKLVERVMLYNKDVRDITNPFAGNNGELKILRPIPQDALNLNTNKDFPQNGAY